MRRKTKPPAATPYSDICTGEPRTDDPTLKEIAARLRQWQKEHPGLLKVEKVGESVGGRLIHLVTVTDREVPDEDKEVVLLIGGEHGNEHSGVTSLLAMIEWLLTPGARTVLERQKVLVIPCVNADGYEEMTQGNRNGVNLYVDYELEDKPTQPESLAVWETVEKHQPEVLCCCHGHWVKVPVAGVYTESNAGSYGSSMYDRPYSRLIAEEMCRAAERLGYPQDRMEEDRERILPPIPGYEHHCFGSGTHLTPGVYAYNRFHTLAFSMEVMIEASGVARLRRLLEIGCSRWRSEYFPGYPTRVISQYGQEFLVAYGSTAAARRRSRAELWQNNHLLTMVMMPHISDIGFAAAGVTVDLDVRKWSKTFVKDVLDELTSDANLHVDGMRRAYGHRVNDWWALSFEGNLQRPGDKLGAMDLGRYKPLDELRHGIALRFRLPRPIRVKEVLGNGRRLKRSETEGYVTWPTPAGWTCLQVNVPPGRSLFCPNGSLKQVFVTASYDVLT